LNCIADERVPAVPAHGHGHGCGEDLAVRAAAASGGRCCRQTKAASSTSAAGGQSVSHLERAGGGGAGEAAQYSAHRCLHVVVVGARWKSRAGCARTAAKDRSCASSIASRRRPSSIVYRLSSIVPQALALKHCDCRRPYTSLGRLLPADRTVRLDLGAAARSHWLCPRPTLDAPP
jgi:hypothetical protein